MYSYRLYKYRDSYVMYIPTVHTFGSVFFTHTLLVQTHTHYVSAPWLLLVVWGVVLWGQVYHLCLLEVVFWLRLRKCWIMLQRTLMEISESKPFWSWHCCQEVLSSWKFVENRGDYTTPCGTPCLIFLGLDFAPLNSTYCIRPPRRNGRSLFNTMIT